ncbi:MAG: type II secretion system protein [Pirellulales bacterium]
MLDHRVRGFTMLELAVVLLIIALVLGGGGVLFIASLRGHQMDDTKARMAAIQQALLDYRHVYQRIPCPADITYTTCAASFGLESGTVDTDTGSSTYGQFIGCAYGSGTPQANFRSGNVYGGMVPTQELNLPDEFAFDGWGRRVLYVVDAAFTVTNALLPTTINPNNGNFVALTDTEPRITITNTMSPGGAVKTSSAAYVLVSFGVNGHGAYPRLGSLVDSVGNCIETSLLPPIAAYSENLDEQQNCHCDADATSTVFDAMFVQHASTSDAANVLDSFDDVVRYATRADLRAAYE